MDKDKGLNSDQVEGRVDRSAAEVKETVGEATGDRALEHEGERDQVLGEAQERHGNVREALDKS